MNGVYAQQQVLNVNRNESSTRISNTPKKIVAPSPPMGWNSWNNFGCDVTEAEFNAQVDYVAFFIQKDEPTNIYLSLAKLGFRGKFVVRDLWARKELGVYDKDFSQLIGKHSAGLYKITPIAK
ncbi:MAG: hypothetical protein ACRC2O_14105 [Chitinophagaceae bacterium]